MIFDLDKLGRLAEEGYLRRARHPEADLWIYNYTEKTQYDGHWTEETLACRGLILDASGQVVARGFPKFFNYGDPQVGEIPNGPFRVTEKIDGSLGITYTIGTEAFIATRGSFTSDQAIEGTRMLRDRELTWEPGTTPLFEIVYPENRIVVDYGDERALYLLGAVWNDTGRDVAPRPRWDGEVVQQWYPERAAEVFEVPDRRNREGYVVSFGAGELRVKFKHAEYVRLHKLITGVNARHIWEALKNGDDLTSMLEGIPDELHRWISDVARELRWQFEGIRDECRQVYDLRPASAGDGDRKMLAQYFQVNSKHPGVLFRMLDGKPYDELIWKAIKPEPTSPSPDSAPKTGKGSPLSTPAPSTGQSHLSAGVRSSLGAESGDGSPASVDVASGAGESSSTGGVRG